MNVRLLHDPYLVGVPVILNHKVTGPVVLYQKIGQGGMGAVYKGWHLRFRCDVAVKILSMNLAAASRQTVRRFQREARIAVRLNHPNIIRCFDINDQGGLNYIILEYIRGQTAQQVLTMHGAPGLPEPMIYVIMAGACSGLAAAHRHDVIHRDVKPHNIMIDIDNRIILMDLGLARKVHADEIGEVTAASDVLGTPHYIPPEMWHGTKNLSTAADVWGMGVTMYKLATGTLPWKTDGAPPAMYNDLAKKIISTDMPDPHRFAPRLSDDLIAILDGCLQKDPNQRYSAEQLRDIFNDMLRKYGSQRIPVQENADLQSPPPGTAMLENILNEINRKEMLDAVYVPKIADPINETTATVESIPDTILDELKKIYARYRRVPDEKILKGISVTMSRKTGLDVTPRRIAEWMTAIDNQSTGGISDSTQPASRSKRIEQTLALIASGKIERWAQRVLGKAEEYEIEAEIMGWREIYPHLDEHMVHRHVQKCLDEEAERLVQSKRISSTRIWLETHGLTFTADEIPTIKSLNLTSPRITSLDPLTNLDALEDLSIRALPANNLTPIGQLPLLKNLSVADCPNISDISPLAACKKLIRLALVNLPLEDVSPLAQLRNLRALKLAGSNVAGLHHLIALNNLERLDLSGSNIADLEPLRALGRLKRLERLDLTGCINLPESFQKNWMGRAQLDALLS